MSTNVQPSAFRQWNGILVSERVYRQFTRTSADECIHHGHCMAHHPLHSVEYLMRDPPDPDVMHALQLKSGVDYGAPHRPALAKVLRVHIVHREHTGVTYHNHFDPDGSVHYHIPPKRAQSTDSWEAKCARELSAYPLVHVVVCDGRCSKLPGSNSSFVYWYMGLYAYRGRQGARDNCILFERLTTKSALRRQVTLEPPEPYPDMDVIDVQHSTVPLPSLVQRDTFRTPKQFSVTPKRSGVYSSVCEHTWATWMQEHNEPFLYERKGTDAFVWSDSSEYATRNEYLPDFYLPRLDLLLEIKGTEPSTDEKNKCSIVASKYNRHIALFWGNAHNGAEGLQWLPGETSPRPAYVQEHPDGGLVVTETPAWMH